MMKIFYLLTVNPMNTKALLLVIFSFLIFFLSACGGGGGSTNVTIPTPTPVPTQIIGINQLEDTIVTPYNYENIIDTEYGKIDKSRVIVYLKDNASNSEFESWVNNKKWVILSFIKMTNVYSIDTNSRNIDELISNLYEVGSLSEVENATFAKGLEPKTLNIADPIYKTNEYKYTWNLDDINANAAWELTYQNRKIFPVKIGVIDTFFNTSHEDNPIYNNYSKIDYIGDEKLKSHGIIVSSIIATPSNEVGMAGVSWANKGVQLYTSSLGNGMPDSFQESLLVLTLSGSRVINLSLGFDKDAEVNKKICFISVKTQEKICPPKTIENMAIFNYKDYRDHLYAIKKIIESFESRDKKYSVLFIQAASNEGEIKDINGSYFATKNGSLLGLAMSSIADKDIRDFFKKRTIVVGAAQKNISKPSQVAPYSNLPDESDIDIPYVIAPGGFADADNLDIKPQIYAMNQSSYDFFPGTSVATPHVTGVAALLLQVNPNLTAQQIQTIILENSNSIPTTDQKLKFKYLNAEKAVQAAIATLAPPPTPSFSLDFTKANFDSVNAAVQGATLITGYNGRPAAKFDLGDGISTDVIYIPNRQELMFDENGATFDIWLRLDSDKGMDGYGVMPSNIWSMSILAKSHDRLGFSWLTHNPDLNFSGIDYGYHTLGSFNSSFQCGNNYNLVSRNPGIKVGEWFRATVSISKTEGTKFYTNKKLNLACPDMKPDFSQANIESLYLGRYSDYWYPFIGAMQDLRIYKKALSSTEIQALP